MWIFAYGSLIWRPDFAYQERVMAAAVGYRRVFWQASPDHRGTPQRPGRVLTLAASDSHVCDGVAYRIADADRELILTALDEREIGGYERQHIEIVKQTGQACKALTYIAMPQNPHYLGAASHAQMVTDILAGCGASGTNRDYVLELHRELLVLGVSDPHVAALAHSLVPHSTI